MGGHAAGQGDAKSPGSGGASPYPELRPAPGLFNRARARSRSLIVAGQKRVALD
jgi:hypothetical protein